jgi:hypothetical protein
MPGVLKMLVRVLAGGRVAAANVAADQAFAELHPSLTGLKALRTPLIAGGYIYLRLL